MRIVFTAEPLSTDKLKMLNNNCNLIAVHREICYHGSQEYHCGSLSSSEQRRIKDKYLSDVVLSKICVPLEINRSSIYSINLFYRPLLLSPGWMEKTKCYSLALKVINDKDAWEDGNKMRIMFLTRKK